MERDNILELLVKMGEYCSAVHRLAESCQAAENEEMAARYLGEYSGMDTALRMLRKEAGISFDEYIEASVLERVTNCEV